MVAKEELHTSDYKLCQEHCPVIFFYSKRITIIENHKNAQFNN